jgi:plastocyanin
LSPFSCLSFLHFFFLFAMFALFFSSLVLLPFISAAIHDVQVGDGGKLLFSPEAIFASPGDQVVFHFRPKNHTVTQSSFADPCGRKNGGLSSGFNPVPANQTDNFPTYTVTVNNTDPIWIYCAQAAKLPNSHCGAGMVFAVNCGADGSPNSFTNFKKAALAVGASLSAAATTSQAYATAAYGSVTIPAAPTPTPVTKVITVGSETWTTTYNSYPNSPDPTPVSAQGQVHKVIVGGPGKLAFDPPHVSARPRDTIVFEFHQKNHSVTQSTFDDPCRPFHVNGASGFDSGYIPVADNVTEFPTWNYTVNDTSPVWAYCKQDKHCGQGMVLSINSDESSGRSFQAFQNVAKALNGTALAVSAPSASASANTSTTSTSGAWRIKVGTSGLILVVGGLLAAVL